MSFTDNVLPAPTPWAPLSACTDRGTGEPRALPRSRSFRGRTAVSATSRLSSPASRPKTARGGAPGRRVTGPDGAVYITDDYADAVTVGAAGR